MKRDQLVCKWFNTQKGFGFLKQESGPDVFIHAEKMKLAGVVIMGPGYIVDCSWDDKRRSVTEIFGVTVPPSVTTGLKQSVEMRDRFGAR